MTNDDQIIQGILNVERCNLRAPNPNGRYPKCKPQVRLTRNRFEPGLQAFGAAFPDIESRCEWCNKPITEASRAVACEAVPPDERWDTLLEGDRDD